MLRLLSAFLVLLVSSALNAQSVVKKNTESKEAFVARIAPAHSFDAKILLQDNLNTPSEKIVFSYYVLEEGNLVKEGRLDSSLCIYVVFLCKLEGETYSYQFFKTNCSYLNSIKVQSAEVATMKKNEKQVQVNVTENVRGPGGVLRGVTRNYVYKQAKINNEYTDKFEPTEPKY